MRFVKSVPTSPDTFRIFSCSISDAFTWTKQPDNPTFVIEGVNSSSVSLEWAYTLHSGERVVSFLIQRGKPDHAGRTNKASWVGNNSIIIEPGLEKDFTASLPSTLELLKVHNDEEFIYYIIFFVTQLSGQSFIKSSQTRIIVNGK